MDADPADQARILVLCLQARAYSEVIGAAREEATTLLRGMRKIASELARSKDPRARAVAAKAKTLIDSTHKELLEALR